MKNLSCVLTVLLCLAPVAYVSAAPVATTSGSNLTAFNPSNANNNQWATLSNGRYDLANAPTAKADFGNCNALILRCAQPKCSNGGCSDASVASAIVKGCVQSNSSCKQYGDDLVQYMTAQLVASSNAKINEQNLAAQQAAAAAAAQQSEQQMQQMQYQMQQMQQQMAQQQAESAQQLQEALAQQAAQNAAALESMKSAATEAAKETEAGITQYQQEAINRGISADIIERQKISGQIMTEIENAEVSLKAVKVAMNNAFEYAKCDARGNNCDGPKRIKKWRELARGFTDPYINTLEHFSEALGVAEVVGIDLSQIYMMLSDSCNRWGQYLCPQMTGGKVVYPNVSTDETQKEPPKVCVNGDESKNCRQCTLIKVLTESKDDQEAVYEGWVNAESSTDNGNTTVVACASGVLNTSKFLKPLAKRKSGANLVDMEMLELWLDQAGIDKKSKYDNIEPYQYCFTGAMTETLRKSALSKSVDTKKMYCKDLKGASSCSNVSDADSAFINPIYAICDVHPYNVGRISGMDTEIDPQDCTEGARKGTEDGFNSCLNTGKIKWAMRVDGVCKVRFCEAGYEPEDHCCKQNDDEEWKDNPKEKPNNEYAKAKMAYDTYMAERYGEMKEIIGLKITVVSQQMYKQYEYLNATLRRLKTQLEKAALTATLETAGAKSEDGSSSGGLLGSSSSKNSQYADCLGKDIQSTLYCLRQNYAALSSQINNKKCDKKTKEQLKTDIGLMNNLLTKDKAEECTDTSSVEKCRVCLGYYNAGLIKLDDENLDREAKRQGRYRD